MSKKSLLVWSFLLLLAGIVIDPYIIGLCTNDSKYCIFGLFSHSIGKPLFIISLPLFLLSLITYKMRDEVFAVWFRFSRVWFPLTLFLVIISPEYGNSLLPVEKDSVSFFMSLLFLLISLTIIIKKYFSLKSNHNK